MNKEQYNPFDFEARPQTIDEITDIIDHRVKTRERFDDVPIELIYFAGNDKDYDNVLEIVAKCFRITYPIYELDLSKERENLRRYIKTNQKTFDSSRDDAVIISCLHFEDYFVRGIGNNRSVHHHDQSIREGGKEGIRKSFPELSKSIITVSHLGTSKGDSVFNRAYGEIAGSQFKSDFLYTKIPND